MKSYQQFFAELKRRRVFKVAAVYGAVAFVLLQVADLLGQGLRLPESFMPFITAVVLLGFPIALLLAWAFEVTPEGMQRTTAATPGEIEGLVAEPASKRWPAGLLALAGLAALLAGAWWAGRQSAPGAAAGLAAGGRADSLQLAYSPMSEDDRPSLAVLPFADMSPEGDQEYFGDGMTEEILNTLAKIRDLRVSGRTSTFAYKDVGKDLRQIGDELGVRYIVEGSVRKAGDQLRITAQLIDARDGSHLWSEQYDRPMDDVFAIQTEIAESIAVQLRVPLGLEGDETLVTPTADLAAYDLYLAGRTKMRDRDASLLEAMEFFEAAIARDSTWAPAWAALAEAREIRIWYPATFGGIPDSVQIQASLDAAGEAARHALELDPRNASALVALGSVQRDRGEWTEAERTYRQAISIDPDNAEAHQQYGEFLREVGRIAESVRALDRAAALDPALIRIAMLAGSLVLDDRLAEALEVYRIGIERDPDLTLPRAWGAAGDALLQAGHYEEAANIWTKLLEKTGPPPGEEWPLPTRDLVQMFVDAMAAGDLSDLPPPSREQAAPQHWMAVGKPDSALAAILRNPGLSSVPGVPMGTFWHPLLDPLRSEPALIAEIRRIGLPTLQPQRTPVAERTIPYVLRGLAGVGAPARATAP